MYRRPSRYLSSVPSYPMSVPMSAPRAYFLQDEDFSDGEIEAPPYSWPDSAGQPAGAPIHENLVGGPSSDVTELYRRKPEEHYVISEEVVMPDETRYYYRSTPVTCVPQRRMPVATAPSAHGGPGVSHPQAYYHPPHEEPRRPSGFDGIVYRSSPHLHRNMSPNAATIIRRPPQMVADPPPPVSNVIRNVRRPSKPAVTVRTPRFYRRTNVYKRPSTLCLPLTSEPDPGHPTTPRPIKTRLPSTMPGLVIPSLGLRSPRYPISPSQKQISNNADRYNMRCSNNEMDDRKTRIKGGVTARSAPPRCSEENLVKEEELDRVQRIIMEQKGMQDYADDSASNNGDIDPKCSELELLLNQYEQIFSNDAESPQVTISNNRMQNAAVKCTRTSSRRSNTRNRVRRKSSGARMTFGMLKPRLPPSLKGLQKNASSKASIKPSKTPSVNEEDRLEIEQMTAEVLDSLLQDLNAEGLAGETPSTTKQIISSEGINRPKDKESMTNNQISKSRPVSRNESTKQTIGRPSSAKAESAELTRRSRKPEDLLLQDGNSKIPTNKSEELTFCELKTYIDASLKPQSSEKDIDISTKTTFIQDNDKFNQFANSSHTSFEQDKIPLHQSPSQLDEEKDKYDKDVEETKINKENMKKSSWIPKKVTKGVNGEGSDDHTALELHRSKSYIVNLIDRALSRELGTIPEERPSKQYINMDARTAINLMSSPAAKNMDNDMCLEITQAIANSLNAAKENSNSGSSHHQQQHHDVGATSSAHHSSSCCTPKEREQNNKAEGELMFSVGNEEPLYIKQLKKLRWGHLKHIQREMRRLEDLERFLDSCTNDEK